MEKQKTTVRVAGKDYALVSTDSPEHLNRVAAYVDRQMTETMRSGRIPANTAAVLTALLLWVAALCVSLYDYHQAYNGWSETSIIEEPSPYGQ